RSEAGWFPFGTTPSSLTAFEASPYFLRLRAIALALRAGSRFAVREATPPNLRVLQNAARCKFQSQMFGCPMEDVKFSCQMTRLLSYPMMDLVSRSLVIG